MQVFLLIHIPMAKADVAQLSSGSRRDGCTKGAAAFDMSTILVVAVLWCEDMDLDRAEPLDRSYISAAFH